MRMAAGSGRTARAADGKAGALRQERLLTALALAAIVLIALFLRWDGLQYAEFNYDQAWSLGHAYDFVRNGVFPTVGIRSSIGTYQGPMELYLLALPVALSTDPLVATAFVGLLQVLAIVGTYLVAARYYGRTPAVVASFLYAVNPWAVAFGRKIWTQSLLPLFAVLFLAALLAGLAERRRHSFTLACLWFAVLYLLHPQAVALLPLLLALAVVQWRRHGLVWLLPGVGLALLLAAPYLWDESQHGFASLLSALNAAGGEASIDPTALNFAFALASGSGLAAAPADASLAGLAAQLLPWAALVGSLLVVAGLLVAACRVWAYLRRGGNGGKALPYLVALCWCALPVLVSTRHALLVQPHYFIVIYPLPFIAAGLAVEACLHTGRQAGWARRVLPTRALAAVVVAVLLLLGVAQAGYAVAAQATAEAPEQQTVWGIPLAYSKQAVASVRELRAALDSPRVYVYASANQWPGIEYLARPDLPLEKVEPPETLVVPHDTGAGVLVVIAANDAAVQPLPFVATGDESPVVRAAHSLGFADLPERTVRGVTGRVYYRFLYLAPEKGKAALASFAKPAQQLTLANGLRLAGLKYPRAVKAGEKVAISVLWGVPRDPASYPWRDYVFFAHVLDGSGTVVAQRDWDIFQYRLLWRADEYVVANYELEIPVAAGQRLVWFDVGAYERYSREPEAWADAAGRETGKAYHGGPLKITSAVPAAEPQVKASHFFGDWLELEGYDLRANQATAGASLTITLHWRARTAPPEDYTVSVQLLDAAGKLLAQHDAPPANGNYPTSYWDEGETVVDRHTVQVPSTATGQCEVRVIVYSSKAQARLSVDGGDSALLTSVAVGGGK